VRSCVGCQLSTGIRRSISVSVWQHWPRREDRWLYHRPLNLQSFLTWQVKNDCKFSQPMPNSSETWTRFNYGLLDESGVDGHFSIPIICIVFALRGSVRGHAHEVPVVIGRCHAIELRPDGQPRFMSYDYWCSGISPELFQPVVGVHTRSG
jgi:hypothetical protein